MNPLGIYFSPSVINIVEVKGKKILNNIQIPAASYANIGIDDKIPEELKIVALFKDELRKNKVTSKEAVICLSANDLIVRTFEVPVLPSNEIDSAVTFEAKKYLPFKIEDLFFSFQYFFDKPTHKNLVLFMGIKKDILEKYISILRQLNIKITAVEYSAFSLLRFIGLSGVREKGVIGVISIDSKSELSADFTVAENGFPFFTRDIKLFTVSQDNPEAKETAGMLAEKLKTEIRISLDYYNRKFPNRKIERLVLINNPDFAGIVEIFAKELAVVFQYIDPSKLSSRQDTCSSLKAYSAALAGVVKTLVKVNIISSWERSKQLREISQSPSELVSLLFADFKLNPKIIAIALSIAACGFLLGLLQKLPLHKELNDIIISRPSIPNVNTQASYEELVQIQNQEEENIGVMDTLLKKQLYLTPQLSAIPALIPENAWLERVGFVKDNQKSSFIIEGRIYAEDGRKAMEQVNSMLIDFKNNPSLSKAFKDIIIESVDTENFRGKTLVSFIISGKSQ